MHHLEVMHHLEIEYQERKAKRAEAAMAELRRREPVIQPAVDWVNHPAHYTQGGIECIDVLEQLAKDGHDFRILNAMKYLWRYRHKGGDESLRKAQWYIERVLDDG